MQLHQQGAQIDYTDQGVPVAVGVEAPTALNHEGIVTVEGAVVREQSVDAGLLQQPQGVPLYLQDQPGQSPSQFMLSQQQEGPSQATANRQWGTSAYGTNSSEAARGNTTSGGGSADRGNPSEGAPLLSS